MFQKLGAYYYAGMMCLVLEGLKYTDKPAEILMHAGILLILSGGLYGLEVIMERYGLIQKEAENTVRVTALNALYEKRLNQELTVKNYLSDRNARLEERENISRNIHNSVGHSITAAIMTLEAADMLFDVAPEQAREKMQAANSRIRESLQTIRRAVRVLDVESGSITLDDLQKSCISIINNFTMDTAICVKMDFPDSSIPLAIPHEQGEFLTGVLEKLLSNGLRHGSADVFLVRILGDSSHLLLSVQDNGTSDFCSKNQEDRQKSCFPIWGLEKER